ncbi:hypothetical protein [Flavobacterium psychrotrophum]|uniref:hypothetical protein n=1 Tax=Flavobacterium psychrotrophum TaxID=2294119 RepID=UPI000E323919|nr:hypothetical protein [Flavobacterium psychrotrophum]
MKIFKVLNTLASSKEEQVSYLIAIGTFPSTDELAIEFDDEYKILLGILNDKKNSFLNSHLNFLNKLNEIDSIFAEMNHANVKIFWDAASLGSEKWNKIRERAKDALNYSKISDIMNLLV